MIREAPAILGGAVLVLAALRMALAVLRRRAKGGAR
jgi:hypothetical protein